VENLQESFKGGCGMVVLGLAFKPCTDDVRDTPTLDIIKMLLEKGAHSEDVRSNGVSAGAPALEWL